jgi:hypothetical protein
LENHGKEWKKIADLIQTRTVVQIRTHAQKYFQKVAKARACGGEVVPGTFKSTAMSTCTKINKLMKKSSKKRKKSDTTTKKRSCTTKKPRSKSTVKSYHVGELNYHQIDNDQLLKLDLFNGKSLTDSVNKKMLSSSGMMPNEQQLQEQYYSSMHGNNDDTGGDTSPTSTVTDLFGGGLDFLIDDFAEYDFDSEHEEDLSPSHSDDSVSTIKSLSTNTGSITGGTTTGGTSSGSSIPSQKMDQLSPVLLAVHSNAYQVPTISSLKSSKATTLMRQNTAKRGTTGFKKHSTQDYVKRSAEESIIDSLLNL